MKKLYSTESAKKLVRIRQLAEKKRHRKLKKDGRRRSRKGAVDAGYSWPSKAQGRNRHVVEPPTEFSLILNPNDTIEFLGTLRQMSKEGKFLYLDMRGVKALTHDAVAALISLMRDADLKVLGGNHPEIPELEDLWKRSGFFQYVRSRSPLPEGPHGNIRHRDNKRVEGVIAKELIIFATEKLYGKSRRDQITYRTLIECMNNTFGHASGHSRERANVIPPRPWWATVYCKPDSQRACFTFIDNGVGIFKSVSDNMRAMKKVAAKLGLTKNSDILRDILLGKIPSSTGLSYRGKGLPKFYKDAISGNLKNFTIISNEAYANVSPSEYWELRRGFSGTCIYWEVTNDGNHSQ